MGRLTKSKAKAVARCVWPLAAGSRLLLADTTDPPPPALRQIRRRLAGSGLSSQPGALPRKHQNEFQLRKPPTASQAAGVQWCAVPKRCRSGFWARAGESALCSPASSELETTQRLGRAGTALEQQDTAAAADGVYCSVRGELLAMAVLLIMAFAQQQWCGGGESPANGAAAQEKHRCWIVARSQVHSASRGGKAMGKLRTESNGGDLRARVVGRRAHGPRAHMRCAEDSQRSKRSMLQASIARQQGRSGRRRSKKRVCAAAARSGEGVREAEGMRVWVGV